ncbi:Candidate beta-glycosyltransferase; Glycosyltransferase family 2 [Flavobacterium johnsoniae UW101]|uniref:Candidate beta-glycosyltransferase Glycosyltransferase family 2 n=1 Tax=Flavobacterium johnsoniae (strain ATCC 17061 / DSM 2064 / JCM 8514 / BCRC 14874 / CCUG 350202 / NBRC 14942 / NCIMB 11054 / UW101) TaxID=376686 RepID=A5FN68_FLAJ1|nr:Candidate beta-glycosyltransferase; Glycosyltransferase family 2 [Flavobacterium johnsoniae UW101]
MIVDFPLISIIVPNYNHENYLKQRLDSIFKQTYQNFEVILLDDCSTDESRKILSEYALNPKVTHCIFNAENSGNTFVQWKKGIELAKGDFVWIAESDDYCDVDFLEKVSIPLINDTQVMLSYCQSNKVDNTGSITGNWIEHTDSLDKESFKKDFVIDGNLFIEKYLIFLNAIPNASAALLRKNNLDISQVLLSNTNLKTCGDWLIYFDQIINYKIAFIAASLNNFRYHTNSVIAKTVILDNRNLIVDINLQMRKVIFTILKFKKPLNYNLVAAKNKEIIKALKYEKSFLLIHDDKKLKGFFILAGVLGQFIQKYQFRKNLKIKLKKFFS